MSRVQDAIDFGLEKHGDQRRKYTGNPYFTEHCIPVADRVREMGGDENMIIAALLHDTVEDTDTTYAEIQERFGSDVADLVHELTDRYTPEDYPDMNRAARKKAEAERLGKASPRAKLIKLCDMADNTKSIVMHDPGFATVYLREKAYLLECMGYRKEDV